MAGEACRREHGFWGFVGVADFTPGPSTSATYRGFWGAIVRSSHFVTPGSGKAGRPVVRDLGFEGLVKVAKITDGTSKTAVVGEKRLRPATYYSYEWHDDKGWADGWDPDTLRSTACPPAQDADRYTVGGMVMGVGSRPEGIPFGSAHSSVFNMAFADASVHQLSYDIDQETFNRLGHRTDDETIDIDAL
jgi:hypothetical protein